MDIVMKLISAVLDVSFNNGHYTIVIKRQFWYISKYTTAAAAAADAVGSGRIESGVEKPADVTFVSLYIHIFIFFRQFSSRS